jgi:hypothetical protein
MRRCCCCHILLLAGHHQWLGAGAEHRAVPHQERHPDRCSNQPRQQVNGLQGQNQTVGAAVAGAGLLACV